MADALHQPLPWWAAGPALGLVISALLGLADKRFGVLGGVTDVVQGSSEGRGLRSWRTLLLAGVVLGAQLGAGRVYALAVAAGVLAGVRLQPRLAGALVRASERSDAAIPAVQAADVL